MQRKATILIISNSDAENDPRVEKQIRFLTGKYRIVLVSRNRDLSRLSGLTVANFDISAGPVVAPAPRDWRSRVVLRISQALNSWKLITHRTRWGTLQSYRKMPHVRKLKAILPTIKADLILVNEIDCLPAACEYSSIKRIVFDAHEYAPREFEDNIKWRLVNQPMITRLCDLYIPNVDILTTVSDGIAEAYRQRYPNTRVEIITSAAWFKPLRPKRTAWPVKLIHHGVAIPSRKLENMIEAIPLLENPTQYRLNIMVVYSNVDYFRKLQALAAAVNKQFNAELVTFLAPVPMSQITEKIAGYDVQIIMIPPTNFNYKYALPNKFFEAIQARNALLVGPMPELARIVAMSRIGLVSESFAPTSIARAIEELRPENVMQFKHNSHRLAGELNAEANQKKLRELVAESLRN